jgi:hypothetical protein
LTFGSQVVGCKPRWLAQFHSILIWGGGIYLMFFCHPIVSAICASTFSSTRESSWGVERCRCIGLTTSPPPTSISRLSRQCGILNISLPYRPPRPLTGTALLYFFYVLSLSSFRPIGFSRSYHPYTSLEAVLTKRYYRQLCCSTLIL